VSKLHSWTLRFAGATIVLCGRTVTLDLAHAIGSQGKILGVDMSEKRLDETRNLLPQEQLTAQAAARAEARWPVGRRRDQQGRAAGTGAERV
jgi:hypothetical protein